MKSTTMHRIVALAATAATFGAACGGDASSAEKSGGEATPLTLRLGTVEGQEFPYAPYVDEFVRSVEETSGGSIDVEVAWEAVPWNPESEQTLATMVSDGEIDLALVPTRVWDELGVTTLRALQAPFLVDNLELLNAIVGSELADELFAGLDTLGVEGLALWPDSLRHPLGFERPLLTANDFDGAQLRVLTSDTSFRLVRALGAEPVAVDFAAGVPAGIDGAEAAFNVSAKPSGARHVHRQHHLLPEGQRPCCQRRIDRVAVRRPARRVATCRDGHHRLRRRHEPHRTRPGGAVLRRRRQRGADGRCRSRRARRAGRTGCGRARGG